MFRITQQHGLRFSQNGTLPQWGNMPHPRRNAVSPRPETIEFIYSIRQRGMSIAYYFSPALTYHKNMARGWESKSVEDQQSSPVSRSSEVETNVHQQDLDRAKQARQKQELDLQRERVLSERTSSPVRRAALEAALADIESRLARLS
jgi:hypothetical protein